MQNHSLSCSRCTFLGASRTERTHFTGGQVSAGLHIHRANDASRAGRRKEGVCVAHLHRALGARRRVALL